MVKRSQDQSAVVVVEATEDVGEVNGGVPGDAGGQLEDVFCARRGGQVGGEGGLPVDGGVDGGAVLEGGGELNELAEVAAGQPGVVADEQLDGGLGPVDALGLGA